MFFDGRARMMELLSFLGPNIVFMSRKVSLEKLPPLVERKIYKTGQTRGASNSEIYQNRVGRNSTVLIPFSQWSECRHPYGKDDEYENGFIVLISPDWYFTTPTTIYSKMESSLVSMLFFSINVVVSGISMENSSRGPVICPTASPSVLQYSETPQ